jgi:hypothetical protein
MKELTFNEWQDHIARQLEADYNKIFNQPKLQINEKFFKIQRNKSKSLRSIQGNRQPLY